MKKIMIVLLVIFSLMISGCDLEDSYDSEFDTYNDVNYAFSVGYPSDFDYEIANQDVIFESMDRDLYYVTSVLLTTSTGGVFSTLLDVQNDYLSQFSAYGAVLEGSATGEMDGFDAIDFAISYTVDGTEYVNRFIVGKDVKYFYVLQFIVPAPQYSSEEEFIGQIIETFTFGESGSIGSVKKGIVGGKFDSTTPGEQPSDKPTQPITPPVVPSEPKVPSEPIVTTPVGESPEECYAPHKILIDEARANNALQDPASGGLYYMYIGLIDSCSSAFESCLAAADAKEDACWNPAPGSGPENQKCIIQSNQDALDCSEVEIACHEAQYKSDCGLTSGTTTTTPITPITSPSAEAEECYSWYDQHFVTLRERHAAQDPYSSSIGLPYDNTEECWSVVGTCNDNAEAKYDSCSPYASQACSAQYNVDLLACVMLSIECGEEFHKERCGLI